jgi:ankyrin repeat protein
VVAISHFFYGRALLHDRQRLAALSHLNPLQACTPAIALCKEPSEENRQYLKELVEARVDMSRIDEYGYLALDYTVFGQDLEIEAFVIKGLRSTIKQDANGKIAQIRTEARLRKGYRELF